MSEPNISEIEPSAIAGQIAALRAEGLDADPDDGTWLAASVGGSVAGVVRVFARDAVMLDDLWVDPAMRRKGIGAALVAAAKERAGELWLVSDEDMIAYYERLGFAERDDLPPGLAAVNEAKGYWQPPDHRHVAMRWPA